MIQKMMMIRVRMMPGRLIMNMLGFPWNVDDSQKFSFCQANNNPPFSQHIFVSESTCVLLAKCVMWTPIYTFEQSPLDFLFITYSAWQMSKFSKAFVLPKMPKLYNISTLSLSNFPNSPFKYCLWLERRMVWWFYGGKHGNSSNFADPPGPDRLEDRSSELKLVYRQIWNVFCIV